MESRDPQPSLSFLVLRTFRADRLLAFYGALGLAFKQERHGRGPAHHACELSGIALEIYPRQPGEPDVPQDGVIVGLSVASVEDALASLAAAGFGPAPLPPAGAGALLTANLKDPDGRKVILAVRR